MVAVGTAEGDVLELVSEGHAIVGVAGGADEGIAVVRTVTNQILHHLGRVRGECVSVKHTACCVRLCDEVRV